MNTSDSERLSVQPLHDAMAGAAPWIQLAKPGVTRLVLITTLFGGLVAPGSQSLWRWAITLLGPTLVVAAASAFNRLLEVDADALMSRTRDRPLPSGRLQKAPVERAAWLALVVGTIGLSCVDLLACALAFVA